MKSKATIYTESEFTGQIVRHEVWLHECGTREYAQFRNAPFAVFTPKGKRKQRRKTWASNNPFVLIVEGWDTPKVGDGMDYTAEGILESRYASFDPRWVQDFAALIDGKLVSGELNAIMDTRKR